MDTGAGQRVQEWWETEPQSLLQMPLLGGPLLKEETLGEFVGTWTETVGSDQLSSSLLNPFLSLLEEKEKLPVHNDPDIKEGTVTI